YLRSVVIITANPALNPSLKDGGVHPPLMNPHQRRICRLKTRSWSGSRTIISVSHRSALQGLADRGHHA
ncbi:MAG: hypothetical protein WBK56_03900, partial [Methanoculleus sp.]